jgi:hypothetical protein
MRKISILNEDYMALEQKIAHALDNANKVLGNATGDVKGKIMLACSTCEADKPFHTHPDFVNFKSQFNFPSVMGDIKSKIINAVRLSREIDNLPLDKAALVSVAHSKLNGDKKDKFGNEVDEVVNFYGTPNTNIPENPDNDFKVAITNDGKSEAIKKLGTIREMFEKLEEVVNKALTTGETKEALTDAMEKIAIIKELVHSLQK